MAQDFSGHFSNWNDWLAIQEQEERMRWARKRSIESIRKQKAIDDAQLWDQLPEESKERIRQELRNS